MKTHLALGLSVILTAVAHSQDSFVLWDESLNGQLSRDGLNPTSLQPLHLGFNTVLSSVEFIPSGPGPGGVLFSDFFILTVPEGTEIVAMELATDRPIAVWVGDDTFSSELGSALNPANGSLLPQLTLNRLFEGLYGVYVSNNDLGPSLSTANYRLDLDLRAVPEPNTWMLFSLCSIALLALRHRSRCTFSDHRIRQRRKP
jgi:hypothetical protein